MLEEDLRTMFDQQAAADQPPTRFSIASITRRARTARRRQIAAGIASPAVAVGAVAAIALAGVLPGGVPAHPTGPGPNISNQSVPKTAPTRFNPFQPYASFGWLPDHTSKHVTDYLFRTELTLSTSTTKPRLQIELDVYAADACHLEASLVTCKYRDGGLMDTRAGRPVGRVDGHTAYWAPLRGQDKLRVPIANPTMLYWRYASGAWAILAYPTLNTALRIARNVNFGPSAARPLKFTVQLQHVPVDWHVFCVTGNWLGNVEYASSFAVTPGKPDANPACGYPHSGPIIDEGLASENACVPLMNNRGKPGVVDGVHVLTENYLGFTSLCANDVDGDFVWIELGEGPLISAVNMFAHHLKAFGPKPANWAASPIG